MSDTYPGDLIPVAHARKLLQVSPTKMSQLLKEGYIRHFPNLLDKRVKLVSEREVLALRGGFKAA